MIRINLQLRCGSLAAVLSSTAAIRLRLPGAATKERSLQLRSQENNFIAFQMFVPAESEMITAFLRHCRRPIAVDDADVEVLLLVKLQYRFRRNGIKHPWA